MSEQIDQELDMRGQRCPAPIIALGRQTRFHPGTLVRLIADDPATVTDVPAWCRMTGAQLVESGALTDSADVAMWFTVRLPAPPSSPKPLSPK